MLRKIHLDFHTNSDVRNVGAGFDPKLFAQTLAEAHVNCLATPGKCQYGNTYYDTRVGHPHPGLVRPDLFPATVKACADRGIRVQAYFTLGLDDVATDRHPDWRQLYKDGTHAHWGSKHVCYASPYADEMVIPEVLDMIERCPGIVGFWFDICLYCNGAFYSPHFERQARARLGADADDEAKRWLLGRELIRECCIRIDAAIKRRMPDAENYFNSLVIPGEPQNIPLQPYQEVENPVLFGGPENMTADVRWLRWHPEHGTADSAATPVEAAVPCRVIGLVSRFQGPWMDPGTLRTPDQMRWDVARSVALGCHVSMGDHRHPDGSLDPAVYRRLAPIYAEVQKLDTVLAGARPVREAVLLSEIERGAPHILPRMPDATKHAARILEEIGVQFDIASTEEALPPAKLVIWPGQKPGSPELLARLRRHVADGGALLAMDAGLAGLEDLCGVRKAVGGVASAESAAGSGISACGHVAAGESEAEFFRLQPDVGGDGFAHVLTKPMPRFEPAAGTEVLAERLPSVSRTPPCVGREPTGAAIVQHGRVIYCAPALFAENTESGTPFPRDVVRLLCERLLDRRLVRHSGGTSVAAHLHGTANGFLLHLVHWAIERWGKQVNPVAEFPVLGPIEVEIAMPLPALAVVLLPQNRRLKAAWADGVCRFTVPRLHVWQVVAIGVKD